MNREHPRTLAELMTAFESLGPNCEFGLAQRSGGAEPLGLLRFASFWSERQLTPIRMLIDALARRFDGLGSPGSIRVAFLDVFMAFDSIYGLKYQTGASDPTASPDDLSERECRQLVFRRRMFLERLETAEHIWVWAGREEPDDEDVRELLRTLCSFGPNRLLLVGNAEGAHAAGTAELLQPNLVRGYVDGFTPLDNVVTKIPTPWFDMCEAAYRLFHPAWTANLMAGEELPIFRAANRIDIVDSWGPLYSYPGVDLGVGCQTPQTATTFLHQPVSVALRNYRIVDARLDGATMIVSARGQRIPETEYLSPPASVDDARREAVRLDDGREYVLARSHGDYYHWMTQAIPAVYWSARNLDRSRIVLLTGHLAPWEAEALELLGCGDIPRISIEAGRQYAVPVLHYTEFQNGRSAFGISATARDAYRRIAAAVDARDPGVADILYVARTIAVTPVLENESDVAALMRQEGVRVIVPDIMPVADRVALFREARAIIGASRSGLTNVVFCRPGTILCEWHPQQSYSPVVARLAQTAMVDYWADVFPGRPGGSGMPEDSSWSVDLDVALRRVRAIKARLRGAERSRPPPSREPVAAALPPRVPAAGAGAGDAAFLGGMFRDWPSAAP